MVSNQSDDSEYKQILFYLTRIIDLILLCNLNIKKQSTIINNSSAKVIFTLDKDEFKFIGIIKLHFWTSEITKWRSNYCVISLATATQYATFCSNRWQERIRNLQSTQLSIWLHENSWINSCTNCCMVHQKPSIWLAPKICVVYCGFHNHFLRITSWVDFTISFFLISFLMGRYFTMSFFSVYL